MHMCTYTNCLHFSICAAPFKAPTHTYIYIYIYTHYITQHYSTCLCRDISTMLSVPLYRQSAQKNSPKLHSIRRTRRTAPHTSPSCEASVE